MSKRQIIDYWIKMAERDWVSVETLLKGKQYMHALFFAHLVIEKILKAYWIKDNENQNPPRSHDLEFIYSQTDLDLTPEYLDLIRVMNSWNLEGRYQDYKDKFYKTSTFDYTSSKLEQVEKFKAWLLLKLRKKK